MRGRIRGYALLLSRPQVVRSGRLHLVVPLLVGAATILTMTASPPALSQDWSLLVGLGGLLISGLLLHAGQERACISLGGGAALLAALLPTWAGGLAVGLLLPVPWYLVLRHRQSGGVGLLLAVGQLLLWSLLRSRLLPPVPNPLLLACLLLLVTLGLDGWRHLGAPPAPEPEPIISAEEGKPHVSVEERFVELYAGVLTPRELQVGHLAVRGISSKEIAEQLFLSESTVKTHLKHLYRKTETANRHDLYRRLMTATEAHEAPPETDRLADVMRASARDAATGLLSRQAFDRMAPELLRAGQEQGQPTALLLLEIQRGSRGDDPLLLAAMGSIFQISLRARDLVFRYSDDQLVALLPGCDTQGVELVGQRMVQRLRIWAWNRPSPPGIRLSSASTTEGSDSVHALLQEARGCRAWTASALTGS